MRTTEFLDNLRVKNIVVFLENGKVKVDAPEQVFTDDFLLELKARKFEILEYLTNDEAEAPIILAERQAIECEEIKLTWLDLCAGCNAPLVEIRNQWFCSAQCQREILTGGRYPQNME